MTDTETVVYTIIANTLGVDVTDLTKESDFSLDLNATQVDLAQIKSEIESTLEVTLPPFDDESPITISDLMALVEDSLL